MKQIKTLTLNTNGINDKVQRKGIYQFLLTQNPDIIFLTETHIKAENVSHFRDEWINMGGSEAIFEPTKQKGSSGVAILFGKNFSPPFDNIKRSIPGRSLSTEVTISNQKHTLLVTYGPNKPNKRAPFFERIILTEATKNKVIWGGDFNNVENVDLDRSIGSRETVHQVGASEIQKYNNIHLLCDPFREKNPLLFKHTFTARNIQGEGIGSQARLDRIYIPKVYSVRSKTKFIHNLPYTDHGCVITSFQIAPQLKRGKPIWKFNVNLLKDQNFISEVNPLLDQIIQTEHLFDSFFDFWESLKGQLKVHAIHFGTRKNEQEKEVLKAAEIVLESLDRGDTNNHMRIRTLEQGIANQRENEMNLLLLQNKLDKIELGEQPSLYFFKRLEHRIETSTLSELTNSQGQVITDQREVLTEAQKFYAKSYTDEGTDSSAQETILQNFEKTISPESYQNKTWKFKI